MNYVLGVDGGGTKTLARAAQVGRDGRLCLLGIGEAAGSNPYSVGWEAAQANLAEAIAKATTGLEIDAAVVAVAGCGSADARDRLMSWATDGRFARHLKVVPDTEPVLAEMPLGAEAVGLIAGTGSAAVVRHADGRSEIVGGWGYLIDDGGSGYAIGRDALRLVAEADDVDEPTSPFVPALLEAVGVERAADLKPQLYTADEPRIWIASLAPIVVRLAEQGDPEARSLLKCGASALVELTLNAASRLSELRPAVRLAGGVLSRSAIYRGLVIDRLLESDWDRQDIAMAPDSACGCARLASGMLGAK